jgi:hypothetical protein
MRSWSRSNGERADAGTATAAFPLTTMCGQDLAEIGDAIALMLGEPDQRLFDDLGVRQVSGLWSR